MKFRVGRAIAGTMAIAAATLIAGTGNASASIPPGISWDHVFSVSGARVYVEEHGDIVSVCDSSANGHSAYVEVRATTDWPYTYKMTAGGYGSCTTHDAGDGGRYNLPEHTGIDIWMDGNGGEISGDRYFYNDH